MITPGPWSPVKPTASSKGWDREKNQQHVPSFEEIQRIEEEKEKQARVRTVFISVILSKTTCVLWLPIMNW